jgi:ATP-dependent Clp protease ATP-binding subunit ClpX
MKVEKATKLACDFCLKDQDELSVLIRGPGDVCICDECIQVAQEIVGGRNEPYPAIDLGMAGGA